MTLCFELYLMTHAFKKDCNDPDRHWAPKKSRGKFGVLDDFGCILVVLLVFVWFFVLLVCCFCLLFYCFCVVLAGFARLVMVF